MTTTAWITLLLMRTSIMRATSLHSGPRSDSRATKSQSTRTPVLRAPRLHPANVANAKLRLQLPHKELGGYDMRANR